jgi:hypothetical protein
MGLLVASGIWTPKQLFLSSRENYSQEAGKQGIYLDLLNCGGVQSMVVGLIKGQTDPSQMLSNFGTGVKNGVELVTDVFGGGGPNMLEGANSGYGGLLKGGTSDDGVSLQSLQSTLNFAG